MPGSRIRLFKCFRNSFLTTINFCFEIYRVDLTELGNGKVWGSGGGYRDLRPYSCECAGILSPEEEMEWHVHHIKNCLTYVDEMQDFNKGLIDLIKRKGEQLNKKKKEAIKRIKAKDIIGTCFDYSKHAAPINKCTNSKQLVEKEEQIAQEIERLSSQAHAAQAQRKRQEEENERSGEEEEIKWQKQHEEWEKRYQEETEFLRLSALIQDCQDLPTLEKNYQIVKNSPLYTTSKKTFADNKEDNKITLDNYFKVTKISLRISQEQSNNHKDGESPNDLKSKFYEIYQKEKKYNWSELMMLLNILEKIEKETSLDNNLQDAKTELQTIQSKTTPYQHQIALIISRGETTKKRLEGLEKYELENCKKALEELEKIICLSELDKHLLKMINCELKVLNLETEIQQLKNQNSSANTPEQQAKTQKKIEEKEKELKEVKKQSKSEENKHFQISPQILSKFQSIPEFTKEKIESLINPVKDNPEFLQEIQTKHQIEDLNALFTDKSPKEIIVIIKRFEYDNLNSEDKKNKDKKIKTYYQQLNQLAKNGKLTEEQINKYLYKEATGGTSNHSQTYSLQDNNSFWNKIRVPLFILVPLAAVVLIIYLLPWIFKKDYYKLYLSNYKSNEIAKKEQAKRELKVISFEKRYFKLIWKQNLNN